MKNIDDQADLLFDEMDAALDGAWWKRGQVQLNYRKDDFVLYSTVYDLRALRTALDAIAENFMRNVGRIPKEEVEAVTDNVIEEYAREIRRSKLPEK